MGSRWSKIFTNYVALIILVASLSPICATQSFTLPKSGRFVLPVSRGKALLDQCSRSVPTGVAEFWEPSAKQIDELEESLSSYLQEREKTGKAIPPKETIFHRQYVGIVTNEGGHSVRSIYGNFYPGDIDEQKYEARRAIGVCDGGPAFWGIVYRLSSKTFEEPAFNGRF